MLETANSKGYYKCSVALENIIRELRLGKIFLIRITSYNSSKHRFKNTSECV